MTAGDLELDLGLPAVTERPPSQVASGPPVVLPAAVEFVRPLVVNVARKEPCEVYVGRSFAGRTDAGWGNRHALRGNTQRARLIAVSSWFDGVGADPSFRERATALAGQVLGCWCAPKLCHGHLLAAIAAGHVEEVASWVGGMRDEITRTPRRLLVTGSRHWTDRRTVEDLLAKAVDAWGTDPPPVLVAGRQRGVDRIAEDWWVSQGLPVDPHEPDWDALGNRAGMVRNHAMIASGADWALALPLGESPGTRGCITAARRAGIPVFVREG